MSEGSFDNQTETLKIAKNLAAAKPHHHHEHPDEYKSRKSFSRLSISLAICIGFMVMEFLGAYWSDSLALLADAFHMLTDALALSIAVMALWLSRRLKAVRDASYGYYRLEVMAAFVNGLLLLGMAGFILYEAYQRFSQVEAVDAQIMLVVGTLGLLANIAMIFVMHSSVEHSLNIKGAFFHVVGDAIASVGVIVGAGFMIWLKTPVPDTIVSVLVALMIGTMAIKLLRDSGHVLMEGTPHSFSATEVKEKLVASFPQIISIHDFHFWQITSNLYAMTAHVDAEVQNLGESQKLIDAINEVVHDTYGITHTTFQIEPTKRKETKSPGK